MIKAIIIEDEKLNADHLCVLLHKDHHDIEILDIIGSIKKAVAWFGKNPVPDVIFLDIQLSDGLGFEIFNRVKITCPIIFTTAYDEYALKAFKLNSIDYLLKPVNRKDLNFAISQLKEQYLKPDVKTDIGSRYNIDEIIQILTYNYKSRFVVNAGIHIRSIETENIACFYSLEKSTFLFDMKGKSYDINYSLDHLESLVNPDRFFRISRKYLVHMPAIEDIITYSANRLKVSIRNFKEDDTLVSRGRTGDFRKWLEK